ncbi:winged helix-turn-helix domain-containing protein [Candidatus Pelagibacter bacterium]|nr:winged helix-turn-helix domain-containing protein [Candidatus Pelagibacter bacterium]
MHKLNVLIFGPSSFTSTLDELKPFLKFNPLFNNMNNKHEVILFHNEALKDENKKNFIGKSGSIKIHASNKKNLSSNYDAYLELPANLKEINVIIENIAAKSKFSKNSSIKIKKYLLNKNEKKLYKQNDFIILTEKETQLLQLFLDKKNPISKDNILSNIWNYSVEADTHTVETHIYRLRKKIKDKFKDEKFILNNKAGYYF